MTEERYRALMQWANEMPSRKRFLCFLNKFLPILIGVLYVVSLGLCMIFCPVYLPGLILRPAFCFAFVTVIRKMINAKRPYDMYDCEPLCSYKPGKNKSFPSRHTASAMIIAFAIGRIFPFWGYITCGLALLTGATRVLCGNHFIKDVIVAIGITIFANFL